jgi:hypothetical protein
VSEELPSAESSGSLLVVEDPADAESAESVDAVPAEAGDAAAEVGPADPPAQATDADAAQPEQATAPAPPRTFGLAYGADLDPAADTAANTLPDLVVDDVGEGTRVNLRNAAPNDTPILLWMWAPH